MHQRSTAPRSRRWVGGILSLLLMTGCFPNPTKAPTGSKSSGTLVAGKPVMSPSDAPPPTEAPIQQPSVPTLPIEVKAPIISHNGGNVIQGTVMAPAKIISHNGGNIIGNNGGNIISHNGGNVVSNGGGNIIGHNGGNLKISQVPLANAVVRLKDAAGKPVKDDKGNELVTKTDENGGYKFPVDVKGRNLVVHAEVPGQTSDLVALLPKEGVAAGTSVAVDMASTLTLSYILELYVKGDLATFEKLPKDLESKARVQTEEAIVKGAIALPETLEKEELIATVSSVIKSDSTVKSTFEEIKKILVIAGIQNEGDGLLATEIPVSTVDGAVSDPDGNLYVFSRSRHTLWKIGTDGRAHTLVPQGKWGYEDGNNSLIGDYSISGMSFDLDGSLILADTNYNRIVRITRDNRVVVIAGTGVPGFAGDGGKAIDAMLNKPTGLIVADNGAILFSDSKNNRIRLLALNGNIETYSGSNSTAAPLNEQDVSSAVFKDPQGLFLSPTGEIYVADYGHNSVRRIIGEKVLVVGAIGGFDGPVSIASERGDIYLLCSNHGGLFNITNDTQKVDVKSISDGTYELSTFSDKKLLVSATDGMYLNDSGRLYEWDGEFKLRHFFGRLPPAYPTGDNLSLAYGMCVIGDDVFVADIAQHKVFKVSSNGEIIHFVGNGISDQYIDKASTLTTVPLSFPNGLSSTRDGGFLIACIGNFPVIRKVSSNGEMSTVIGNGQTTYSNVPTGEAKKIPLTSPHEVVELPNGEIIFVEPEQNRMFRLGNDGIVRQLFVGEDLKYPSSLALDTDGKLNYCELRGSRLVYLDGNLRRTRLDLATLAPEIQSGTSIRDIVFDRKGNILVATKDQILQIASDGRKSIVAGLKGRILNGKTKDTGLFDVENLEITQSGDLYILETTQLKKVPSSIWTSANASE